MMEMSRSLFAFGCHDKTDKQNEQTHCWVFCLIGAQTEECDSLQEVRLHQGTLTLILKGEVSVQLTSLYLPVRTRLF